MTALFQDLRYALRGFLKTPVLTAAALLSLALGIGANTAIFSLTDRVLLRTLPVKNPEQIVLFTAPGPRSGSVETSYSDEVSFSYPMYGDFRDHAPALDGVLARFPMRLSMAWGDRTELVNGELATGNYFDVLGVTTSLGRALAPEDDRPGKTNPVVVLSYNFWKNRFGGTPVLNQTVRLNGIALTVIGVAQPGFSGVAVGEAPDVFLPITLQPRMTKMFPGIPDRRSYWLNIFARVKPGTPREQAETILNGFWKPILEDELRQTPNSSAQFRQRFIKRHLNLTSGARGISAFRDQASGPLLVLIGMVGVLLLITCANIANLLIARAAGRRKEIAIRLAIGAGRGRLLRQLIVEGLSLSVAGGLLGLLVASWAGDLLLGFLPTDSSVTGLSASPDLRVLYFALALATITGVFFGLAPALDAWRMDVASSLKEQASSVAGSAPQVRLRHLLVTGQIGLSLVLLIGAGLFARSLFNLRQIDPGFRAGNILGFAVQPSLNGYDQTRIRSIYEQIRRSISAIPQVQGVAMGEIPLLANSNDTSSLLVPGYEPKESDVARTDENWIGAGYLSTMGIPLLSGREITAQDGPNSPLVAVVNEPFAQLYLEGRDPIGRRFSFGRNKAAKQVEIVGVVRDTKHAGLREKRGPFAYLPYSQHDSIMGMTFYVRTLQDAATIGPSLRAIVREVDPNLPVFDMKTIDRQIDESMFADRLVAMLATFFGLLATLLSAIGLYGVMSYTVSRRTREIGLRMALGAARNEVLSMIMREVGVLALIGIAIAVPAAFAVSRLFESQLYGVKGNDPAVFTMATLALIAVAACAGLIPAFRATRIDPMHALRNE